MPRNIRYGDFAQATSVHHIKISYNQLVPQIEQDSDGEDIPYRPARLKLRSMDIGRLLKPYVSVRLIDQIKSVVPLALYLVLFLVVILRQGISDSWAIAGGLTAVIVGLMLFMEGLTLGLMHRIELIAKLPGEPWKGAGT